MQRAATLVDILAIRRCVQDFCLYAALFKQFRRFGGGGSVGAIHQHAHPAQIGFYIACQPIDIFAPQLCFARQAGDRASGTNRRLALELRKDFLFNGCFAGVRKFVAIA